MNTGVIPMIVSISIFTIIVVPTIYLFIRHPPKAIDPCKVIDAFGDAVETGRQQKVNDSLTDSCL